MWRRELCTFAVLAVGAAALPARASQLYDWGSDPSQVTTTVTNYTDGSLPGREITKLWVAEDANNYYFRMDLAGGPTNTGPVDDFAEAYAIDITGTGGGDNAPADPNGSTYIAAGLSDIKYIVMTHASAFQSGLFTMDHFHTFDPTAPDHVDTEYLVAGQGTPLLAGAAVDRTEGDTEMQWEIPISALPAGGFTIYGSTVDTTDGVTYTVTSPIEVAVPEPVALAMTSAVGGLFLLRRRHRA